MGKSRSFICSGLPDEDPDSFLNYRSEEEMYPQDCSCAKFEAKIFVWVRDTAVNVMYYAMWESWSFLCQDSLI